MKYVSSTLCVLGIIIAFVALIGLNIYLLKNTKNEGNKIRQSALIDKASTDHKGCTVKIINKKHNESIGYLNTASISACGKTYKYEYKCVTDHWNGGTIDCKWRNQ